MYKRPTNKVVFLLTLILALSGCGDDDKKGKGEEIVPELPPGVVLQKGEVQSEKGLYIVKPSTDHIHPSEDPRFVIYTIVTADRKAVAEGTEVTVKYGMPSMPKMKITPAVVKLLDDGRFEVQYDIPHGGDWEFRLSIGVGGTEIDSATIKLDIREEEEHGEGDEDDHDHDGDGDPDHGDEDHDPDHDHGDDHDHDHDHE